MAKKRGYWLYIILLLFILASSLVGLITDYWWFTAVGFEQIFLISLKAKISVFLIAGLLFFSFAMVNVWISSRLNHNKTGPFNLKRKGLIVVILSVLVGWIASANWFTLLQYLNQTPFNIGDPIFNQDVSFYVFTLPFLQWIWGAVMTAIIMVTILVVLDYFQGFFTKGFKQVKYEPNPNQSLPNQQMPNFKAMWKQINRGAIIHITVLASLVFLLFAIKHYLAQFSIMYSEKGIVVGAGYTDVMIFLPIVKILMVFALVVTVLFYVWLFFFSTNPKLKKRHIIGTIVGAYILFVFIAPTVGPALVQSFRVDPNELNLEKPYIENNIAFTRMAYGLDSVEEKDFAAEKRVTADMLTGASETIDNVRLLDWRPLTQTYKQTQEIRSYYDLSGIDIDRYMIDGKYTQVMVAPRELDQNQLAENAKTWVNLHLVFTHGFGLVMSPVNSVTDQGLPDFLVSDIPPKSTVSDDVLDIDQPRIYYGERDNDYVLVNTETEEFDFPQGSTNQYIRYDGTGGVVLDSFLKKVLIAVRFKDIKILLSSDLTPESKIMFHRSIQDRIRTVTPFLMLDMDPYLVVEDGRMVWIQDGYTVTGNYPYSQKLGRINYMRNAVKIVVDAYDGSLTYYIADSEDPLMQTYANIFPDQFKHIDEMPSGLRDHLRYPVDLFEVQARMYATYHMEDPTVFYNKEDSWEIPSEIYGTGQKVRVDPYYIIMKLPGETKEEFILMISFAPIQKDNMIAWMAARSDGEHYGKLLLFSFPKDKLVYGPLQIEAKFDQDAEISEKLTLWSQQGSRVTRGNLLVIPIEDSLLYIEPLYLQAEQGQLPQLKQVLVSDGDKVVMKETLGEALEALFGKASKPTTDEEGEREQPPIDGSLTDQANRHYQDILDAMQQNDWTAFGESFDSLGKVLESLRE